MVYAILGIMNNVKQKQKLYIDFEKIMIYFIWVKMVDFMFIFYLVPKPKKIPRSAGL